MQPTDAELAEDIVPINILCSELRRRSIASVGHADGSADSVAALGEVESVSDISADAVIAHPFYKRGVDSALENEVLYEPADLVIREGGYDCGAKSEAAAQSARDIVFSAAFPSGERSRILYSARARIEAEHYLAERYFIKHAILGSFEFKLHKLYFLSCRIY